MTPTAMPGNAGTGRAGLLEALCVWPLAGFLHTGLSGASPVFALADQPMAGLVNVGAGRAGLYARSGVDGLALAGCARTVPSGAPPQISDTTQR